MNQYSNLNKVLYLPKIILSQGSTKLAQRSLKISKNILHI